MPPNCSRLPRTKSKGTRAIQLQINPFRLNLPYRNQIRRKWNWRTNFLNLRAAYRAENVIELRPEKPALRSRLPEYHLLPVSSLRISPPIPAPILLKFR